MSKKTQNLAIVCMCVCVHAYMRARVCVWLDHYLLVLPLKVAKWNLGKLYKDKSATMTGTLSVQGPKPEESPPVQLSWKVYRIISCTEVYT